ncbi:polysaccharide biosynthesis tyrosine autokinase [Geobacter sp.]|uniref:polysaccharide biosynthesis tyrosine autokinase n=1 Tax=Geobacter sp. TaxID=46610 RepID=UPI002620AAB8|nr:polysaccharide biosynthesis tyrosine autokinase [Geobacter sp.]
MNTLKIADKAPERIEGSSIGNILVQAGRLTTQDLNRIVALQGKENILFGEAAVALGILTDEDVRWALASQYSYPCTGGDGERYSRELLALHEPFGSSVESFRSIRSALLLSGAGKLVTSIGVMSPGEGEGKSFIAANLALVFAQLGSRTLLVDLNFRAPRAHSMFQLKNNCGASSLIIKRALLEDAVQRTSLNTLDILPSGPKPPNPLELLSWNDTKELFGTLREQYEVIIVDTPAFGKTADALVLSGLCDGALLVALKGTTKNAAFGQMKKQLEGAGARVLGAVVNEVAAERR